MVRMLESDVNIVEANKVGIDLPSCAVAWHQIKSAIAKRIRTHGSIIFMALPCRTFLMGMCT